VQLTYTIPEAARQLSVSRATIYRLFESGELEYRKVLGRTVVTHGALLRFIGEEKKAA
jgi:excisionase family DNA binding protein